MDRNRENANVETPIDVSTEIEKVVAAAERRSVDGCREGRDAAQRRYEEEKEEEEPAIRRERIGVASTRNPLSKFSTCGAREIGRKVRVATMPERRKRDRRSGTWLAAACQDVASVGGQIIGQSLDESVPANATYLVEVSLEEIVESCPVDLVDVSLDESFEEFSIGGKERDRLAANTKRKNVEQRESDG
ncbi:unnamed protein product, partial [Heterotrigona itama]